MSDDRTSRQFLAGSFFALVAGAICTLLLVATIWVLPAVGGVMIAALFLGVPVAIGIVGQHWWRALTITARSHSLIAGLHRDLAERENAKV